MRPASNKATTAFHTTQTLEATLDYDELLFTQTLKAKFLAIHPYGMANKHDTTKRWYSSSRSRNPPPAQGRFPKTQQSRLSDNLAWLSPPPKRSKHGHYSPTARLMSTNPIRNNWQQTVNQSRTLRVAESIIRKKKKKLRHRCTSLIPSQQPLLCFAF